MKISMITMTKEELHLIKAEQLIKGYIYSEYGYSFVALLYAMNLKEEQWKKLVELHPNYADYLTEEEAEEYFSAKKGGTE